MRRILLLLCGIMFIPVLCYPQHLVEVGKGYSCTSVNTTVFRNNSLITVMSSISAIMMLKVILYWENVN